MKNYLVAFSFLISVECVAQPFLYPPKIDPYFINQGQDWVDSLMSEMTLKEKIGQLLMVAAFSNKNQQHEKDLELLIEKYGIGGLIFFQGGPIRQAHITNRLQAKSKVPLLIAMDAEWGVGMRLDSTISFPYQMGLGAIQENKLIYQMGVEIGRQLAALGVQINFAPVVDINNNPDNPVIGFRSFGEDIRNVSEKGYQYMKGMQDAGLIVTAKHFPGHGDTGTDSHHDLPILNFERYRLDSVELVPFKLMINKGLSGVMVAHMSIPQLDNTPNLPTTLSQPTIQGLLKEELGFNGIVFTDALNMSGVTKHFENGEIAVKALLAGNDVLLYPEDVLKAINAVYEAVDANQIDELLIDEKCRKVLSAKYFTGLSKYRPIDVDQLSKNLNNASGQLLLRKLIEGSLTILENKGDLIPLKKLDSLKIASISVGKTERTDFQRMLSKYTLIDHFNLEAKASQADISKIKAELSNYNLVIIGLHDTRKRPYNSKIYSNDVYGFLNEIAGSGKGLITSFRNPYSLDRIASINTVQGLITTYEDTQLHEELAAQLIFGAIGATGRLPVKIGDKYNVVDGLDSEGGIRLKYTIPLETGMNGERLEERIDLIIQKGLNAEAYPGAQVFIAKDQKVIFHKTYGHHTYDRKQKVSEDNIYDLASVTKVSAPLAALMRFHDEGKFNLDVPFGEYWDFGWFNKKNKLLTREVLAHQSGLEAWIPYHTTTKKKSGRFRPRTLSFTQTKDYSIRLTDSLFLHKDYKPQIYKMIRKSDVKPDQGYVYSGLPFYLFPEIIETKSRISYENYLKTTFYNPLGANTLTFNPTRFYSTDRIIPTENDTYFRNVQLHGIVHDEGAAMMSGYSGNAGLFGTANDLAKLWQMYLNMGSYGGAEFITKQTLTEFSSCQYCEEGNRRGLGFDKPLIEYSKTASSVAEQASHASFGHSGYTGTFVWADPEYDLLYIFLSNRVYPTRDNRKIYDMNIRPDIHTVIYEEMGVN
ncbi:MAG: glycoside hydrolase family 3 N-terminal domain-containing protein [Cyclobacteriaceae bacterium]